MIFKCELSRQANSYAATIAKTAMLQQLQKQLCCNNCKNSYAGIIAKTAMLELLQKQLCCSNVCKHSNGDAAATSQAYVKPQGGSFTTLGFKLLASLWQSVSCCIFLNKRIFVTYETLFCFPCQLTHTNTAQLLVPAACIAPANSRCSRVEHEPFAHAFVTSNYTA